MNANVMPTKVAVYAIAADPTGIWWLTGDRPWMSEAVPYDSMPFMEADLLLDRVKEQFGVRPAITHQTSDLARPGLQVCNFGAVYNVRGLVRDEWPNAEVFDVRSILEALGGPQAHPADQPPSVVSVLDVALHVLRHFAFLNIHDGGVQKALPMTMRRKLKDISPDLFRLFLMNYETAATVPAAIEERHAA